MRSNFKAHPHLIKSVYETPQRIRLLGCWILYKGWLHREPPYLIRDNIFGVMIIFGIVMTPQRMDCPIQGMLMPELPYPSKTTKGDNDWNKIYETLTRNL